MKQKKYILLTDFGLLIGLCLLFGDDSSKMIIPKVDEIVAPSEANVKSLLEALA